MTYLDAILAQRRADMRMDGDGASEAALDARIAAHGGRARRSFAAALRAGPAPAIVAEFKRASPSAGDISPRADVAATARAYAAGGAAAISVLTEERHFKGGFADLAAARAACSLPLLCKDFVVDARQLAFAAAAGADAVLLIVAALEAGELEELILRAETFDLEALVEVHDEREADAALAAGATLVGINNRDLRTFEVDTRTALRIAPRLAGKCTSVAESGYTSADELRACAAAGIDAVLVGERLMRSSDVAAAIRELAPWVRR